MRVPAARCRLHIRTKGRSQCGPSNRAAPECTPEGFASGLPARDPGYPPAPLSRPGKSDYPNSFLSAGCWEYAEQDLSATDTSMPVELPLVVYKRSQRERIGQTPSVAITASTFDRDAHWVSQQYFWPIPFHLPFDLSAPVRQSTLKMDGAVLQVLRETLSPDQAVRQHAEQQLNHLLIVPGQCLCRRSSLVPVASVV